MDFIIRLPHIFFTPERTKSTITVSSSSESEDFASSSATASAAITALYSSLSENYSSEESHGRAFITSSGCNAATLLDISNVSLRKPIYSK